MTPSMTRRRCWCASSWKRRGATSHGPRLAPNKRVGVGCDEEQAQALPGSGGTIGPCRDGTVIEVECTEWITLAHALPTEPTAGVTPRTQHGDIRSSTPSTPESSEIMTLHVVMYQYFDDYEIIGICSSHEKAKERKRTHVESDQWRRDHPGTHKDQYYKRIEIFEMELDEGLPEERWPKSAGSQGPDDTVQIVMAEANARAVERQFFKPRGIQLAGPLLFGPEDSPTYILSPEGP